MIRLGLCCTFEDQPIRYRTTTAKATGKLERSAQLEKLSDLALTNAAALRTSIETCAELGIGAFRINSQILPLKTHPTVGYQVAELPAATTIVDAFEECGRLAESRDVRLSFHPDQFVVLSSPRADVVQSSLQEIEYQTEVARWVGADAINIHGGGGYGEKPAALRRFAESFARLSTAAQARLTVENDDRVYTPEDLLPLCDSIGIPLTYDVHHHRCLTDRLSVERATELAVATWAGRTDGRRPLFHLSSPLEGWDGPKPNRHHDYITLSDFPAGWRDLDLTIDVEAKKKELAVLQLRTALESERVDTWRPMVRG